MLLLLWGMPVMAAEQTTADLRLLIDVSGSMKKNDPQNLRVPAVRLLVGMLPEETYSGIWIFGHRVTSVLKVSRVNEDWRRKARSAADKIHSRELYTDIEQALRKASSDWTDANPRFRRNIILLTDGLVDISKNQGENEASRRRIIEQLLPRIAASGAKIHTIALSANSDHDLMEQLSAATGGWYEQVDDAKSLDRLFLRLFEQSTTPDTLPLNGNRFTVDGSISDMTVLAFRYPADDSLSLVTPNGKRFSVRNYPANVRWLRETNYDLITVDNPSQGEWRLDAPEDPDNRVTVVTNLRLEVDPIPAHFTIAETPALYARLQYDSTSVKRPDFLEWVHFSLHDTAQSSGEQTTIPFRDGGEPPDVKAGDGTHSGVFGDDLKPGLHELVVVADGGSFSREHRQMVKVYRHAVDARIVPKGGDPSNVLGYRLDVQVEPALLQTESLRVKGFLERTDTKGIPLIRTAHNKWRMELPNASSGDIVEFEINGLGRGGNPYFLSRRLRIEGEEQQVPARIETEEEKTGEEDEQAPQTTSSEMNWGITTVFIFVENLLLGLLIWLGYMLWKRQTTGPEKPGTESKTEQTAEAVDAAAAKPDSEPDTAETVKEQQDQPSTEPTGDINPGTEDEISSNETPTSTLPSDTEQGLQQADSYTIEELDDELNATLEAWDDQSAAAQLSDEELEAGNKLDSLKSLEETITNTTAAADDGIEKELNVAAQDVQIQPEATDATADASLEDEIQAVATTTAPENAQQDEAPQEQPDKQPEAGGSGDATKSELSDTDLETLSIDLSEGAGLSEESSNEPNQATQEKERGAAPDTEAAQAGDRLVDNDEQDELLASLQGTEEQQSDPKQSLREGPGSISKETDNTMTGTTAETIPEQISSDDRPDARQQEPPEGSQNMAR